MMVTADRKQNIFQSPFDISDPLINFSDVFRDTGKVEEGAGVPCLPVRQGGLPTAKSTCASPATWSVLLYTSYGIDSV